MGLGTPCFFWKGFSLLNLSSSCRWFVKDVFFLPCRAFVAVQVSDISGFLWRLLDLLYFLSYLALVALSFLQFPLEDFGRVYGNMLFHHSKHNDQGDAHPNKNKQINSKLS